MMPDTEDLAFARQWLDRIGTLHHQGKPATQVYSLLTHHAHDLDREIGQLSFSPVRKDLLSVQAQTLTHAGNVAFFDLGQHAIAEIDYRNALRAAKRSSEPKLQAWTYMEMARRRLYEANRKADDPANRAALHEARQYAGQARGATERDPVYDVATLKVSAEIEAELGDVSSMMTMLDRASERLRHVDMRNLPVWCSQLGPSRIASMEGACWLRLGNPKRATASLESALASTDSDLTHNVVVLSDASRAWAMQGEPERAASRLAGTIPVARTAKSAMRTARVRDARAALDPWRGERFVRELDEMLSDASLAQTA